MNKKKLLMFGLPLLAISLVMATIGYYALVQFSVYAIQPITVNGEPISEDAIIYTGFDGIECEAEDTCVGEESIKIANSADEDKLITLSGDDVNYVGKLLLTTKDTGTWQPTTDKEATVIYTLVGEEFETEVELGEGEVLVYAMDKDDRFVNYASVIKVEDVDGDLPYSSDWNADADPNYCANANGFDSYEHCVGAKLWIVKESDIDTESCEGIVCPLSWANMNSYLYETDLIRYFDNAEGKIIIPANSYIEFYPQVTVDRYASTGDIPIEIYIL